MILAVKFLASIFVVQIRNCMRIALETFWFDSNGESACLVIKDHITSDDTHAHYLGRVIQYVLILLLARAIKSHFMKKQGK